MASKDSDQLKVKVPSTWNFVKDFFKHPLSVSSLIKSSITVIDKNILKKNFELEDLCSIICREIKQQNELDSYIMELYKNHL